jgi:subtilisin family serine protease
MRLRPLLAALFLLTSPALAGSPDGAGVLRVMGASAEPVLAPGSGKIGALVALPPGIAAASLGLDPIAPGIGRMRASAAAIIAFADAHPDLHVEVAPPIHLLMDRANGAVRSNFARVDRGANGEGTLIGIVDTGIDVTHPDFKDDQGNTRIAWLLDLSERPLGLHPELEQKFGGAVYSGADIDARLKGGLSVPRDEVGHGTHVAGIAAASGLTPYIGVAPKAGLIIARVTRSPTDSIEAGDLLLGAQFIFDRADAEKKPTVANFSIGADFGPHDGTMLWEKAIASFVGPAHPGRAIVAAAGNSGSIASTPIHQTAYVAHGARTNVRFFTGGTQTGSIQIWVTERAGSKLSVGLDGPSGGLIPPIPDGTQQGKNQNGLQAGVVHGSKVPGSLVPDDSRGAIVVLAGHVPKGVFTVTLEGEGMADLYLQATGGAQSTSGFESGVRESTITLPATHPDIIGVGCTVSRTSWSVPGTMLELHPPVPLLDGPGGRPDPDAGTRYPEDGEVCWFSSAGPTLTGVQKPEISAPGAAIIASMSAQAAPGTPASIFSDPQCAKCLQIDPHHAVSMGTSMASPVVAGVVALLFQRDPTLTQTMVRDLLQAGAHRFRGSAPFMDQAGPGEVDALSSLEALDEARAPAGLPTLENSWITLSADYAPADGSIPITALVELRTDDPPCGKTRCDPKTRASGFEDGRVAADVRVGGRVLSPAPRIVRRAPGLFVYQATIPAGHGGEIATFGATFDGAPIVTPVSIPVATDPWTARYDDNVAGGCRVAPNVWLDAAVPGAVLFGLVMAARRRARSSDRSSGRHPHRRC